MKRREILFALPAITYACAFPKRVLAQGGEEIVIEWRILPDQLELVPDDAPLEEGEPADTRNPLLVGAIVLVGAWAAPKIAQAVLDVYHRYQGGGVIIDLRSLPLVVETSPRIPPGFALIISDDGAETLSLGGVDPLKPDDLAEFIANAAKGG